MGSSVRLHLALRDLRGYYTRQDFLEICEWKTRGRPRRHYQRNSEEDVRLATAVALSTGDERCGYYRSSHCRAYPGPPHRCSCIWVTKSAIRFSMSGHCGLRSASAAITIFNSGGNTCWPHRGRGKAREMDSERVGVSPGPHATNNGTGASLTSYPLARRAH